MAVTISKERIRNSKTPYPSLEAASESDRARVVFSAPFRRMQEKAQVFSLEDDAAVRSRLTHSLEVAHIGKYLTRKVVDKARSHEEDVGFDSHDQRAAAQNIVEVACLLHDIGNPPFGHFGEKVIRQWFQNNREYFKRLLRADKIIAKNDLPEFERFYQDFLQFDGNPQGFRIVSKLQWNYDENGLNLTVTQLAALLKYDCDPSGVGTGSPVQKKPGYFFSERAVLDQVREKLDMAPIRHPLSYLMEAADDVAYCLSDIEDGIEKGLVTADDIDSAIQSSNSHLLKEVHEEKGRLAEGATKLEVLHIYLGIKTDLTNKLAERLASGFIDFLSRINKETMPSLRDQIKEVDEALKVFQDLAVNKLYSSRVVRENEIIANRVITGILDSFKCLLECNRSRFESARLGHKNDSQSKPISVEAAICTQLSDKYFKVYDHDSVSNTQIANEEIREWIARAHLIVDYVSGMTDRFALNRFRLMCSP